VLADADQLPVRSSGRRSVHGQRFDRAGKRDAERRRVAGADGVAPVRPVAPIASEVNRPRVYPVAGERSWTASSREHGGMQFAVIRGG
jgi:hypothetical protein